MITSCASRKSFHRSRLSLGRVGKTRARTSSRPLRFEKKVTVNGAITLHHHYLYRGYLQIVALDKKRANLQDLWLLHWDPNEPVATRPLSIRIIATWFTYGYDLTKNVQEIFNTSGGIATSYDYTPFGAVSVEGTLKQPIQWSSEAYDTELALTYYNYRHYNPMDGRWINRDPINEQGGANLYGFVGNGVMALVDILGFRKYKKINVYVSATGNFNLWQAERVPQSTIDSLREAIKSQVGECECVEKLQLIIHSNPTGLYLNNKDDKKKCKQWTDQLGGQSNMITMNNVETAFGSLIKDSGDSLFCNPCTIYMESCHLGLGSIPQAIADATGCKVRAAKGYSGGKAGWPSWSGSRKYIKGLEEIPNSSDGYSFFESQIPCAEEIE